MIRPLRSTGITPLHHSYEAVRPSPAHRYFQPRGGSRLRFFPWHRRPGSHVPYKSLIELRAAFMPNAACAVSVHRPSLALADGSASAVSDCVNVFHMHRRYAALTRSFAPCHHRCVGLIPRLQHRPCAASRRSHCKPASASALNSHCDLSGPASSPIRLRILPVSSTAMLVLTETHKRRRSTSMPAEH